MEKWQSKAILEINPNAEYNFTIGQDGSISEIDWKNNTTPISMNDINSKAEELKAKQEYIGLRAKQYPSIEEQLDMQYWDSVNDTTNWKDAIAKVKSDNPKPE